MRRSVGFSSENEWVSAINSEIEAMKTVAMENFAILSSCGSRVLEVVGDCEENGSLVERSEKGEGKREADCTVGDLDDSDVKKVKRSEEDGVSEGIENKLMIGGVWKRVTHDEVINMASAVRILV